MQLDRSETNTAELSGATASAPAAAAPPRKATSWVGFAAGAACVAASTGLSWSVFGRDQLADIVMIYLLGIVIVSLRFGYGPSILATVLSVFAFDFFFVPPYFTFAVADLRHTITFGVMFFVALVISHLTKRVRDQASEARERERRTASLYAMSRELVQSRSTEQMMRTAARHLGDIFGARICVLLPDANDDLASVGAGIGEETFVPEEGELAIARRAWARQRPAGIGAEAMPTGKSLYLPLRASRGAIGVIGIRPAHEDRFEDPDELRMTELFAGQIAGALERALLADQAESARIEIQTEQHRSALLSSVSHDLRTPLAAITGAASTMLDEAAPIDGATRKDLLQTVAEEAQRLNHLVGNLLDMTRLEAGQIRVKKEWLPLEEVIGAALGRIEVKIGVRKVTTTLPDRMLQAPMDPVLIEQVLINLLENAAKYTPPDSPIDIAVRQGGDAVEIEIADRGAGVAEGEHERVFEKFYRASVGKGGVGLGLTICRGIVAAHGGRIWAFDREGGGACFAFTLPLDKGRGKPSA